MHADDISRRQFALYADSERGRYPVWQGLDLDGFMPGSGVVFATVTVAIALTTDSDQTLLNMFAGRLLETCRGPARP